MSKPFLEVIINWEAASQGWVFPPLVLEEYKGFAHYWSFQCKAVLVSNEICLSPLQEVIGRGSLSNLLPASATLLYGE